MDINSVKKIGSPGQNVVIETAGKIYVKVQDRFYELDFRNKNNSINNTIIGTSVSTPDLSNYVNKEYLASALNSYVTTKTWQSVKATQEALQNANISGFTDSISPVTIDTMQLLVGAEQLQYDFVDTLGHYTFGGKSIDTSPPTPNMPTLDGLSTIISLPPYFEDETTLVCPAGFIKHYVYGGPEAVQSGMHDFQYCRWILTDKENYTLPNNGFDFSSGASQDAETIENWKEDYLTSIVIDEKIYYLYIQADYIDVEGKTITIEIPDSEPILTWYETVASQLHIVDYTLSFSQLVRLYDAYLGLKKSRYAQGELDWEETQYEEFEKYLINLLYNFKIGTAHYVITEIPLNEYEYDDNGDIIAYNFLYAIVGNNGSSGRSITTLNGFTEITPGQVTAYIFKTPDGQQYINFKDGTLHIGNPYENKKGEWMHYSPDGGLEISGQLTVTGGPLLTELEKLTKLANGEYNIWYSDDAIYADPSLPNWRELEESTAAGLDGVSPKEEVDETSDESGFEQYFPFPNDVDPDRASISDPDAWYQKKNWPAYLWENPDTRQEHEGDLYVISRNIRINGSTPVTPDSDDERNNEVNLTFRYRSDKVKNSNNEEITIYYWSLLDNSDIGLVLNTLEGYDYLKAALNEPTTIIGGLILTSAIELGYTASDGRRWTTAGISGIKRDITNNTDIAAWFGGYRKDPVEYVNGRTGDARNIDYTVRPSGATWDYPQTLFRLDGSGYIGGLNSDNIPAIQWDAQSLTIRDDISVVDNNGNVISTLGNLGNYFEEYTLPNNAGTAIKLKSKYAGIISDGFISAFGYSGSEGGSGSGDASWPDNPFDGGLLVWSNTEGNPIWVHPEDLTVGTATNALSAGEANQLKTSRSIWGQLFNGSQDISGNMSGVGNIAFGTNAPLFTFTGNNPYLTIQGDLHVTGHIVADSYISAFGTSSSEGSSGGDANSIAGKLVIEPSDWTGLDGKTLIYDSSENDGEGAWVIGNAGISASNSPSDNYLLGWSSSSAQWVNPNSITVGSANYLANGGLTLWGNSNVGTSGNMNVGTSGSVANLSYVGNINFGSTGTSGIYFSTNTPSGTPASTDNLYLKGNLIVSGYISAFGESNSGGSSGGSGDATSIDGIDVNINNPTNNQYLGYSNGEWTNLSLPTYNIPIITLNGTQTTSPNFYAPTGAGSLGQILYSTGNTPNWISPSSLTVNRATTANKLHTAVSLWGNTFDGSTSIGAGEDGTDTATIQNVADLIFGVPSGAEEASAENYLALSLEGNASYDTSNTLHVYGGLNIHGGITGSTVTSSGNISATGAVRGSTVSFGSNPFVLGGNSTIGTLTRGSTTFLTFAADKIYSYKTVDITGSLIISGTGSIGTDLTVKGNYIYFKNSTYYLKYEANSGNPYLHTNLPIVSDGFITAYGVSSTTPVVPEDGGSEDGGGSTEDAGGNSEW